MLSAKPEADLKTIIVSKRFACCKMQQMRFPKKITQASPHQRLCTTKKAHLSLQVPKISSQQNEVILLRKDFGYLQTKMCFFVFHNRWAPSPKIDVNVIIFYTIFQLHFSKSQLLSLFPPYNMIGASCGHDFFTDVKNKSRRTF